MDKGQKMHRLARNSLQKGRGFGEGEETAHGIFSRFCRYAQLTCQVQAIWQIYSSSDLKQDRN